MFPVHFIKLIDRFDCQQSFLIVYFIINVYYERVEVLVKMFLLYFRIELFYGLLKKIIVFVD